MNRFDSLLIMCMKDKIPLPFTNIIITDMIWDYDKKEWYVIWRNDIEIPTINNCVFSRGGGTDLDGIRKLLKNKDYISKN